MSEIMITKNNIDEVLHSDKPVLFDFYANWCGPCQMLMPVINEVAEEMSDKVVVGKVNIDDQMELAGKYGVSTIPTLMVFKDGKPVTRAVGYMPKENIVGLLEAV